MLLYSSHIVLISAEPPVHIPTPPTRPVNIIFPRPVTKRSRCNVQSQKFNVSYGGVDSLVRGRLSGSIAVRMKINGTRETPREKEKAGESDKGSEAAIAGNDSPWVCCAT